MTTAEELDKLKKLHDDGTITDEQYERARANLHDEEQPARDREDRDERALGPADQRRGRSRDDDYDDYRPSPRRRRRQAREWGMILHLSLLFGHTVALGGIIAPIVIWQMKKDEYPEIDTHGKNAVNWLITWLLYMLVSFVLAFVIVGIPMLIVGGVLGLVFPIIAGLKANEGQVWKYPMAITFLK